MLATVPRSTRCAAAPPLGYTIFCQTGIEQWALLKQVRIPELDFSEQGGAMAALGWEALKQWGDDVARIEPLAGGVANDVWSVRVNGQLAVGRLGARSDADLAWETELLQHLDREGLTVPVPIPTTDGRLFAGRSGGDDLRGGRTARDGGRLASRGRHAPPAASVDAGLAAAPRLAIVDRPPARRDRDEDRPRRDAA